MKQNNRRTDEIRFEVRIPDLEGDGIAEVVTIVVPVRVTKAGDKILTKEALDLIEQTQARYMGLMRPLEIKELRSRLGLTQREMSDAIQAGEKSYTRWETGGGRLSRLVNVLLCAIRDGFLPLPYLRTLRKKGSDWWKMERPYEATRQKKVFCPTLVTTKYECSPAPVIPLAA